MFDVFSSIWPTAELCNSGGLWRLRNEKNTAGEAFLVLPTSVKAEKLHSMQEG